MPKVIRHDYGQLTHRGWAALALFIACLLGFIAGYPTGARWVSNAAQAAFSNAVNQAPEPVFVAKKPVRYEAVIDNWKRYRSESKPKE